MGGIFGDGGGVTPEVELATDFNGTAVDPFGNARAGFEGSVTIWPTSRRPTTLAASTVG
jgi:hypothetical protein